MLVGDIVRHNARHRSGDEALVMGDVRFTYGELNRRINQVASALEQTGIRKGDRVAALGRNSLEYVQLYFALAKIGAILVPLNFWHRVNEHAYTLDDAQPRAAFVAPDMKELLAEAAGDAAIEFYPLPGEDSGQDDWDDFVARGTSQTEPEVDLDPSDAHMILYTSGTTGKPKGAVLSHRRTVEDALGMVAALRIRSDDTFINYFPPFHVGNWDHMKLYLLMGARVVLMREFEPGNVLETMEREDVSVVLGVPTMLHGLLGHPEFDEFDLSSVRLLYYGAYDPSGIMMRTAEVFGAKRGEVEMAHTYGLTEAGPFVTLCPPQDLFDHWGSIGRPIPGVEVALMDDEDQEVPVGEPGEICIRGPRLTEYWERPEETKEALTSGWFHTGDIAIADQEGFLRIVDRKKDMIRSGGQNVYSKEVEDRLQIHDAVEDAAVIGLPDPVYEEQVCAVVVLKDPEQASDELKQSLREHVRASMAGYNTPKVVHFVEELPKNAVGKTQKHVLRDEFGSMFDQEAHGADVD